jgi:hypothetical protein
MFNEIIEFVKTKKNWRIEMTIPKMYKVKYKPNINFVCYGITLDKKEAEQWVAMLNAQSNCQAKIEEMN